jgi:hypothetical protein
LPHRDASVDDLLAKLDHALSLCFPSGASSVDNEDGGEDEDDDKDEDEEEVGI